MWDYQLLKASGNASHFPYKVDSWERDRAVSGHAGPIPALDNLWAKPMAVPELSAGHPHSMQFWSLVWKNKVPHLIGCVGPGIQTDGRRFIVFL